MKQRAIDFWNDQVVPKVAPEITEADVETVCYYRTKYPQSALRAVVDCARFGIGPAFGKSTSFLEKTMDVLEGQPVTEDNRKGINAHTNKDRKIVD